MYFRDDREKRDQKQKKLKVKKEEKFKNENHDIYEVSLCFSDLYSKELDQSFCI